MNIWEILGIEKTKEEIVITMLKDGVDEKVIFK